MEGLLADMWIPSATELKLFSPTLGLIGTIVAVLVVALAAGRGRHLASGVALLGVLVTLGLTCWSAGDVAGAGYGGMAPGASPPMLLADNFTVFFHLLLMLFLALVIWLWLLGGLEPGPKPPQARGSAVAPPEFFVLLLTSALGMALMVSSLNLLVIVIAIELASLPSYAIVASDKRSRIAAEASVKYVVFGAGSAALMVYGMSLLYGYFGTLDVAMIGAKLAGPGPGVGLIVWLGLILMGAGIAFKIAAVPFHFWCPDVFEGAPVEITTWLSVASKAAGLGLLLRLVHALSLVPTGADLLTPMAMGIGLVAAVTCTVGNLAALRQESVKRMLAYSSIAHAGYMMMAAAILTPAGEGQYLNPALGAVIAYLFCYLIMNLGAFGVTAMVSWQAGDDKLASFTGLGRRAPWLALPMAVCLFSLVGLPPLAGFAAKWWLLAALGQAAENQTWLWALVIVAVLNTVVSLFYYVTIIRRMYLTDDERQPVLRAPLGGLVMVNACAVALLLLGTVLFNPLGTQARAYASNLFGETSAAASSPDATPASPPDLETTVLSAAVPATDEPTHD